MPFVIVALVANKLVALSKLVTFAFTVDVFVNDPVDTVILDNVAAPVILILLAVNKLVILPKLLVALVTIKLVPLMFVTVHTFPAILNTLRRQVILDELVITIFVTVMFVADRRVVAVTFATLILFPVYKFAEMFVTLTTFPLYAFEMMVFVIVA